MIVPVIRGDTAYEEPRHDRLHRGNGDEKISWRRFANARLGDVTFPPFTSR
jgi:hypothetical protein